MKVKQWGECGYSRDKMGYIRRKFRSRTSDNWTDEKQRWEESEKGREEKRREEERSSKKRKSEERRSRRAKR
jgi:hypothetical protein